MSTSIDEPFDAAVMASDPSMVIVTTAVGDERSGCLVGFHCQAAISPRRYAVWLSTVNHTTGLAPLATHFAVHFLTERDHDLAELFGSTSDDDIDKFEHCDWTPGPGGVPLLSRCANRFVGRRVALLDTDGDHRCLTLEPLSATAAQQPRPPLRLSDVSDVEASHPA